MPVQHRIDIAQLTARATAAIAAPCTSLAPHPGPPKAAGMLHGDVVISKDRRQDFCRSHGPVAARATIHADTKHIVAYAAFVHKASVNLTEEILEPVLVLVKHISLDLLRQSKMLGLLRWIVSEHPVELVEAMRVS